eukprot:363836-Chlamydomonas_euryale.AAC.8
MLAFQQICSDLLEQTSLASTARARKYLFATSKREEEGEGGQVERRRVHPPPPPRTSNAAAPRGACAVPVRRKCGDVDTSRRRRDTKMSGAAKGADQEAWYTVGAAPPALLELQESTLTWL